MAVSFDRRVTVPPHVLMQELQGESVFLHTSAERYFGLDPVGTRMWALLTGSDSIQAAYEQLLREYEVEPAQLRHDLEELVQKLVDNGLVEIAPQ